MTVICASRSHNTMAGDTRMNCGPVHFPSVKIYRINDELCGMAGSSVECNKFEKWLRDGKPSDLPDINGEDGFEAIILNHEGIFVYEHDCVPVRVDRDYHAIGSGQQAAIAALMCNKSPKQAVEIACRIDFQCGTPVTVLEL